MVAAVVGREDAEPEFIAHAGVGGAGAVANTNWSGHVLTMFHVILSQQEKCRA
jgi:hypothetical protein